MSPAQSARRKTNAIMRGLQDLSAASMDTKPSASFADNYNRMRDLMIEAYPHLEKDLPPRATVKSTGDTSAQSYREFKVWGEEFMGFHLSEDRKAKGPSESISIFQRNASRVRTDAFGRPTDDPAMG